MGFETFEGPDVITLNSLLPTKCRDSPNPNIPKLDYRSLPSSRMPYGLSPYYGPSLYHTGPLGRVATKQITPEWLPTISQLVAVRGENKAKIC